MLAPLPDELENMLSELADCGPYVDDDQYDADQRRALEKLQKLGLVVHGWLVSPAGRARVRQLREDE